MEIDRIEPIDRLGGRLNEPRHCMGLCAMGPEENGTGWTGWTNIKGNKSGTLRSGGEMGHGTGMGDGGDEKSVIRCCRG